MPSDLEEKLSLTLTTQQQALTKQARDNGEGMKAILTTHSVLSWANGEKECHTLEKKFRGTAAAAGVIFDPV
jgi:hypothetical protein